LAWAGAMPDGSAQRERVAAAIAAGVGAQRQPGEPTAESPAAAPGQNGPQCGWSLAVPRGDEGRLPVVPGQYVLCKGEEEADGEAGAGAAPMYAVLVLQLCDDTAAFIGRFLLRWDQLPGHLQLREPQPAEPQTLYLTNEVRELWMESVVQEIEVLEPHDQLLRNYKAHSWGREEDGGLEDYVYRLDKTCARPRRRRRAARGAKRSPASLGSACAGPAVRDLQPGPGQILGCSARLMARPRARRLSADESKLLPVQTRNVFLRYHHMTLGAVRAPAGCARPCRGGLTTRPGPHRRATRTSSLPTC